MDHEANNRIIPNGNANLKTKKTAKCPQEIAVKVLLLLVVLWPLTVKAQCDPGPATGGGTNRCYEDGYVYVDVTGNSEGYTWYWGYQNPSQIQGGFLLFHSRTNLDANTVQLLTDAYDVSGQPLPPPPYAGTFAGPGLIIPDSPVSRSFVNIITSPPLSIQTTPTNSLVLSWPSPSTGWSLYENGDLTSTNWTQVSTAPADNGVLKTLTVWPPDGNRFYVLRKP